QRDSRASVIAATRQRCRASRRRGFRPCPDRRSDLLMTAEELGRQLELAEHRGRAAVQITERTVKEQDAYFACAYAVNRETGVRPDPRAAELLRRGWVQLSDSGWHRTAAGWQAASQPGGKG